MPSNIQPPSPVAAPAKTGWWRLRHEAMSGHDRRHAFKQLVADAGMDPGERLSRMRTLVDMGLWEDIPAKGSQKASWVRRLVGLFEALPWAQALDSYATNECWEFSQSFLDAIRPSQPPQVLHLLIEAGMDLEVKDFANQGDTPLLMAVRHDLPDHAALLLRAGADPNVADMEGTSVLGLAVGKFALAPLREDRRMDLVDDLLEHGADVHDGKVSSIMRSHAPVLWAAAATLEPAIVRRLLAAGASPVWEEATCAPIFIHIMERSLTNDWSPEMGQGFMEIGGMLLAAGASLSDPGAHGAPPLLHAACRGNGVALLALLELGADPEIVDQEGWTLAHHLVFNFEPDHPAAQAVLAKIAPACWEWKDRDGNTPRSALSAKLEEYGGEDYDIGPWMAIIGHAQIEQATPGPPSVKPRARL